MNAKTPAEILSQMQQADTMVFGHRGAKAYAPMNTMAAFELAAEQGAHGVELDVHRSADGYPVILHDFTIDSTTDGSGTITDMTLAQIRELDAGSWFDERFAGAKIPTLDEVFEALGDRLLFNVEIKSEQQTSDGVEQVVADCIRRHNMTERVIVSSFNPLVLKNFRQVMPEVPLGYLVYEGIPESVRAMIQPDEYEAYHPHDVMIDAVLMAQARKHGHQVNTWTVNDPQRARELAKLGVSVIISDNPDVILDALK